MNNWNILLEDTENGFTSATVLEVPNLKTTDKTKQGAIRKVTQLLENRLAKAEIIQISTSSKSNVSKNSLMKFAGIFQDDSDFADIITELQAEREDSDEI
ncbi:MAG: hypothetical protein AAFY63_04890 [Cyanobacteria bacterium J06643_13]